MIAHKLPLVSNLRKVDSQPEQWDREKLLVFMDTYNLQNNDVAIGIGICKQYFCRLKKDELSFTSFNTMLTAYKNAIKKSKVAAVKAYAKSMIKHYNSFK